MGRAGRANVQIYGALDSFLQYARIGSQTSVGLMSGGASTSRFGFIGSEDLGGGLRASFRLESGFDLMSGRPQSAASFYNREANVAIGSADWGRSSSASSIRRSCRKRPIRSISSASCRRSPAPR